MQTRKKSFLIIMAIIAFFGLMAATSTTSGVSVNICTCHPDGRYQYLDILEGNGTIPSSIDVGETKTVIVVVENRVSAGLNITMSDINLTLSSVNKRFTVQTPTFAVGSLSPGRANATWQITGVSVGSDNFNIKATAQTTHLSRPRFFSDSYSPSPSIDVVSPPPSPTPTPTPGGNSGIGIPGLPYEFIILGIVLGAMLLWLLYRRH